MQQYLEVKKKYPDTFLFYRLGDFYEMFFDDAKKASVILELTLTGRDCGEDERAPMCGVPYHAADNYIARLVSKGYKVAICEQMEDPATAKGIVKREIVRVVTPGTVTDNSMLDEKKYNYISALFLQGDKAALAFADASTGDMSVVFLSGANIEDKIISESERYSPREILSNVNIEEFKKLKEYYRDRIKAMVTACSDGFEYDGALVRVKRQLGKNAPEELINNPVMTGAVGALLAYIAETQKSDISYIRSVNVYNDGQYLELDPSSRRNLEICETMRTKEKKGSLLWVLDKTVTSMGARLLRKWLEMPLVNTRYIERRQQAVGELKDNYLMRRELTESLRPVLDIERLMAKVVYGTANAKDIRCVAETLSVVSQVKSQLADAQNGYLLHSTLLPTMWAALRVSRGATDSAGASPAAESAVSTANRAMAGVLFSRLR